MGAYEVESGFAGVGMNAENNLRAADPKTVNGRVGEGFVLVIGEILQVRHRNAWHSRVDHANRIAARQSAERRAASDRVHRHSIFSDVAVRKDDAVDHRVVTKIEVPIGAIASIARDGIPPPPTPVVEEILVIKYLAGRIFSDHRLNSPDLVTDLGGGGDEIGVREGTVGANDFYPCILEAGTGVDRKSTRLNSSHRCISYAVFCL